KHIQLTADLDFVGAEIEPIAGLGSFTGEFDGNGHVISKGQINKTNSSQIGVFRQVGEGGEIRNLGVEEINVSGDDYVGGLVGWNEGTITSCYATGAVSGGWNIGGLVGSSVGTITSCYATGTVSGEGNHVGGLVGRNYHGTITSCYATETVSGDYYVGGLVGSSVGTITSCYATGAVSGDDYVGGLVGYTSYGTITSCYATGVVSGSSYVGGLVGRNYHGTITSCYWDISTSGVIGSAGGEGRTTDQMTYPYSSDTYVDWDFEETWVADVDGQNGGYPYLQSVPLEPAVVLPELQILQILPDGTVELSLDAQAGSQYEIQAGPDLNTWTAITNITATNATTIFVDPAASGNDRRFYRAVVP
ncbi:MAG: hypothetical protein K9N52_07085, partial [Verrucomicrobia bacterium]|nr:hypothetical protein [Verrucomicrobiota bacterium]